MKDAVKIFVDSDAFVALTVNTDAHHEKAISILNNLRINHVLFLTSNYVFSESITVISMRSGHKTAVKYIEEMQSLESPFQIKRVGEAIEEKAVQIFKAQTSKNTSFVDCVNMALVKELGLDAIFSFDQAYRKNKLTLASEL